MKGVYPSFRRPIVSLERKFLKTKPVCKVKFSVSGGPFDEAKKVSLVGDFNAWSIDQLPLKRTKDGAWTVSHDFRKDQEYQFRYVIDGHQWINEPEADRFIFNGIDAENSVLTL
jgi:1,4-alpha-glucan branching enzyme